MNDDLANDELLDMPLGNLRPGELRRAFQVQAIAAEKRQEAEIERIRSISVLQHREEEAKYEHEEFEQREAALLANLQEREWQTALEARELDARTINLNDGRRAYVDGDRYRDEHGKELSGADQAEAEQHHLDQPHAATWQEHQEIERQKAEELRLRQKLEALDKDDPDAAKRLDGYEREFKLSHDAHEAHLQKLPDYGSGDYMAELGGLTATFGQAGSSTGAAKVIPSPAVAVPTPTTPVAAPAF